MKLVSIVAPCYNEAANVVELYERITSVLNNYKEVSYEIIFIDNASEDNTVDILKSIAEKDKNIKIIVNTRNFGHVRSPFYAILQAKGDAVIIMASDLQDPPELLGEFIKKWNEGYKIVVGIKEKSEENKILFYLRRFYYRLLNNVSELDLISNCTGFGLYDRKVVEIIRDMDERYPYFRGLIAEIGFDRYEISYTQNKRKRGLSKNNFYSLYDFAMLGFVNHSRLPLRLAAFLGFLSSVVSLFVGIFYFLYKLIYWQNFQVGMAPIVIGLFFFSSIQMFFLGVVGEYIGIIYLQTRKRPLVVEKERINFNGR
jgi:glycosyltransferase involved in cell wall biosynthesis